MYYLSNAKIFVLAMAVEYMLIYILFTGKIGIRSIYYYTSTTISAVILGIILVLIIRPGEYHSQGAFATDDTKAPRNVTTVDTLLDLIRYIYKYISLCCNELLVFLFYEILSVYLSEMCSLRILYKLALLKYVYM